MWLYAMQAPRRMRTYARAYMCCCCTRAYQYLDAPTMLDPRILTPGDPGLSSFSWIADPLILRSTIRHIRTSGSSFHLTVYCRTLHTPGYSIRVCPTTPWACTVHAACAIWV